MNGEVTYKKLVLISFTYTNNKPVSVYEGNFSAHALTLVGQLKLLLNHMSEKFSSGMKNHKQTLKK